ncbi:hypothetical protein BX600DRAFT_511160 [Xylariales sp. PMI_506]|nr:hypothetical protein BX600DRAFT_511160 [Xylariales sp. PMI_506]
MDTPRAGKKRTRVFSGCNACRIRHVKCDDSVPSCNACLTDGIECIRPSSIRFKCGLDQSDGMSTFPDTQVWVEPTGDLNFHDETPRISRLYNILEWIESDDAQDSTLIEPHYPVNSTDPTSPSIASRGEARSPGSSWLGQPEATDTPIPFSPLGNRRRMASIEATIHAATSAQNSPATPQTGIIYSSPASSISVEGRPAVLSEREALLMRNFIENMALWADISDPGRHFETEVPRRALFHPVLRYALFAFSSLHIARKNPGVNAEALEYYNACLNLLIPTISAKDSFITEETHATVAILRQFEEMDSEDRQLHLTGTTQIVNSMKRINFTQGLSEAAAWLCLRQDIYISLARQTPIKTDLDAFLQSAVFERQDDLSYAARMVYLLAKAQACAFSKDASTDVGQARLQTVRGKVEDWFTSKAPTFNPIKEVPRDIAAGRRFPEIWMLLPCHVLGLQYYYIAKIVLFISLQAQRNQGGFDSLMDGRKTANGVRNYLRHVVALATSNRKAENTLFTARHALELWGGVFHDSGDQEVVEGFLNDMKELTGWNTAPVIASLREQWAED